MRSIRRRIHVENLVWMVGNSPGSIRAMSRRTAAGAGSAAAAQAPAPGARDSSDPAAAEIALAFGPRLAVEHAHSDGGVGAIVRMNRFSDS